MDRRKLGILSEAKATAFLIENDYEVFTPVADNGSIDRLVIKENKIERVSIKGVGSKNKHGTYTVTLKTVSRRNNSEVAVNLFDNTKVDKLVIYIAPEDRCVILDSKDIKSKNQITVDGIASG